MRQNRVLKWSAQRKPRSQGNEEKVGRERRFWLGGRRESGGLEVEEIHWLARGVKELHGVNVQ